MTDTVSDTNAYADTDDKFVRLDASIVRYVRDQVEPLDDVRRGLVEATAALGGVAEMQIPTDQGVFLTLLTKLVGARVAFEVGTFTGYSTLALAEGVGAGGTVVTCDISTEWDAVARAAWSAAGVEDRIRTEYRPAHQTLAALPNVPFVDIAFIDADKVGYVDYWEALVPRVRRGGLVVADNVLYYGEAASPEATGNAQAIRRFNEHVKRDDRVQAVMLTVADGLTVALKL